MNKLFLVTLLSIISITLFSQKQFVNGNYKLPTGRVKIAVVPFFAIDKLYTQALYEDLLKDSLSSVSLTDSNIIIQSITTDTLVNASIKKIINKEYTSGELKNHPGLLSLLNAQTVSYIKQMFSNSDVLLVPLSVTSKTVTKISGKGNTTLYGRFKMYDLRSGDLIFDFSAKEKVNYLIGSNEVAKQMDVLLKSFHSFYVKNFIEKNKIQ